MASNQQRREAAKRKLERQQERRGQREQRRKRMSVIVAVVAVLAVVGAIVAVASLTGPSKPADDLAAGQPPVGACRYVKDPQGPARPVGFPSTADPATTGTVPAILATNQGALELTLDRAKAPCTVESFVHLAANLFFNGTPCHRLVTGQSLKVLQCGDPTGKGSGGPGYTIPDEKPVGLKPAAGGQAAIYPRGTVAMANTGSPNSGGSQFFLVYGDSMLPPNYTIFATIAEPGVKVLEKIALGGNDGSSGSPEDGAPNLATVIQTVSIPGVTPDPRNSAGG